MHSWKACGDMVETTQLVNHDSFKEVPETCTHGSVMRQHSLRVLILHFFESYRHIRELTTFSS
jgi:hypothetical protein